MQIEKSSVFTTDKEHILMVDFTNTYLISILCFFTSRTHIMFGAAMCPISSLLLQLEAAMQPSLAHEI